MWKTRLEVSPDLTSTLIYLRNRSFFDEEEGRRKIKKSDASTRKIASLTVKSKNTVNKEINILKDKEIVTATDQWYYIEDIPMNQSSIELPGNFVSIMNQTFHEDLFKTYNWLYREYQYALQDHRECLFSYKSIIEQGLGLTYNQDRIKKVKRYIGQLILNGLINIQKRKVKTIRGGKYTYLFKLTAINCDKDIVEVITEKLDEDTEDIEEYQGDISALNNEEYEYEDSEEIGFINTQSYERRRPYNLIPLN